MDREPETPPGGMEEFDRLRELMIRSRAGDGRATGDLLRGISPKLRGYIRRQLRKSGRNEPADVEDLLQTTLMAIHAKRHTYEAAQPLSSWVYAIARYKVVDHLRSTQRSWSNAPIDDASHLAAADETWAADAAGDLSRMLAVLPPRTRALVEAVKLEGMTSAEAARGTGMSEAAVKVAVHRALRKMASLFASREPADDGM